MTPPLTTQVVVPLQQPLLQEFEVHVHWPALHSRPVSHVLQATPPVPQALAAPASWQRPFASQHPLGQEAGVHAHLPCAVHTCLAAQALHMPPAAPQFMASGLATHAPLAQQPAHAPPPQVQAPLEQLCPVAHLPHALPPEPHAAVPWSAERTHLLPSQQPIEHEAVVHSQVPAAPHAWPLAHVEQAAPAVPHLFLSWPG
jgi:hypothetical protein